MESDLLVVVDTSAVREGKGEALEAAIGELAEFVRRNEPRVLAYHVYFNHDRSQMTVLQVHPDSASMEFHMEVAGPAFPQFSELLDMVSMRVYGRASAPLLDRLQKKAAMLGDVRLEVHEPHSGFERCMAADALSESRR